MKSRSQVIAAVLLIGWLGNGTAQVSVSGISEYQLGNLSGQSPQNLSSLYTKIDLGYYHSNMLIGLRAEQFQSTEDGRSYQHFSQRYVEWQDGPVKIRAGHFYTTLGRGLLLRAYELPNVIFEQRSFRRRYAYYRDLDGLMIHGQWSGFEFIALRGEPLNNEFPPQLETIDRRDGVAEGGQVAIRPMRWLEIGDAYLRFTRRDRPAQEMNSVFSQIKIGRLLRPLGWGAASLNLYAEHARLNSGVDDFFSHSYTSPHATFLSLNFSNRKIGFSAEFKEYRDFENGINLPPIGYKEHSYHLLNRSTHELLADNEKGHQFELSLRPLDNLFLVAHQSRAINDYGFGRLRFSDSFLEATMTLSEKVIGKLFFDKARDDIKSVADQVTGGAELEWSFPVSYTHLRAHET